jgi:hypothetical protein
MALKLMMDGKELGSVEGDKIVTPDGESVNVNTDVQETMTVPLNPDILHRPAARAARTDGAVTDDGTPVIDATENEPVINVDQNALEIKLLQKQNEALVEQLKNLAPQHVRTNQAGDTEIEIKDLVKDLTEEEDPHGIGRTVKQLVIGMKQINDRVQRVDQFFNFQEYQKAVNSAKEDYKEYFNDTKIGPLVSRMLDSALRTDSTNPLPVIVANVIKDVKSAGIDPKGGKVIKDIKTKSKVPPTIRSTDGTSPSITVNKPKSLEEAKNQYAVWRAARAKAAEQGRT